MVARRGIVRAVKELSRTFFLPGIWGQVLFIEIASLVSPPLQHVNYLSSFLRTFQMNPPLRRGCSVIMRIRIAVVPNDRLTIILSLPHMIRVAQCSNSANPWHAQP